MPEPSEPPPVPVFFLSDSTGITAETMGNALLIQWKRAGLSYKDIKRIGGFKEAESTLRGRFRTLTKAKEQRVRKPKWLKSDVSIPFPPCIPGDESRRIEWTSNIEMSIAKR